MSKKKTEKLCAPFGITICFENLITNTRHNKSTVHRMVLVVWMLCCSIHRQRYPNGNNQQPHTSTNIACTHLVCALLYKMNGFTGSLFSPFDHTKALTLSQSVAVLANDVNYSVKLRRSRLNGVFEFVSQRRKIQVGSRYAMRIRMVLEKVDFCDQNQPSSMCTQESIEAQIKRKISHIIVIIGCTNISRIPMKSKMRINWIKEKKRRIIRAQIEKTNE